MHQKSNSKTFVHFEDKEANFTSSQEKPNFDLISRSSSIQSSKEIIFDHQTSTSTSGGPSFRLIFVTIVTFLTNSLPSGYNLGVVNTPEDTFKAFFNASISRTSTNDDTTQKIELLWSVAVSLLLVGAVIGCTFTGYLADSFGRRPAILFNSLTFLLGVCLCWAAKFTPTFGGVTLFMTGRFVAGVATGVGSSLIPLYLTELAPKKMATAFGAVHIMGLTGGQTVAMSLGLESVFGSTGSWELLFAFLAGCIFFGLIGLVWAAPESPFYLFVLAKREDEAVKVLKFLRSGRNNFEEDVGSLKAESKAREISGSDRPGLFTLLRTSKSFRNALLVGCVLHGGQQLVGINAINYYSTKTFKGVGLSAIVAQYSSIGCSTLSAISCFLSIPLLKKFPKRKLFLGSAGATTVCLLLLTTSMTFKAQLPWLNWATVVLILLYVFFFTIGQAPIPFLIGSDLFEPSSVALGMSVCCLFNWFCNIIVGMTFPLLVLSINQFVFLIFMALNALVFAFAYFKLPNRPV